MKRAIFIIILLAILAGCIADYWWYRAQQLPPTAPDVVKNASLRMNDCISYRLQTSNITYGELFEKLQKDITEIDSKIIDLQSVQTNQNAAKLKPLLDYLHAGIELLRAQVMLLHRELAWTNGRERAKEAQQEYAAAPSTSNQYEFRRADRARDEVLKAVQEFKQSEQAIKVSLDALSRSRQAALGVVSASILCDAQLTAKLQEKADDELKAMASMAGNR